MSALSAGSVDRAATWAVLAIWLVPVLWTVNLVIARVAPGVVGPYALAMGRWALAGVMLTAWAGPELWRERRQILRDGWRYVLLGFLGMLVCGAWVYVGAQTTSAMNISLIYSASPVLIALGAVYWLGERMRRLQAVGVVLALAGVWHVVVRGEWTRLGQVQWVVGDLYIVAAMAAWAAYALLQKRWPNRMSEQARLAAICWGGVLTLVPGTWGEMTSPAYPALGWQALGLMAAGAVFPGMLAFGLYGWAQRQVGASRVAMSLYLNPLYAALAAMLVLNEALGWHHVVGSVLILLGVYLVSRRG